jgi:cytochrome c biogenesis protein CcmG/thiol:disulfide interchange protein DsbE
MRRLVYILPVLVFAAVAAYFVMQLRHEQETSFRDSSIPPSALIGKAAPPIDLPPLEDGAAKLTSEDFKAGPVVLNFFASWCVPCRVEHPLLARLAKENGVTLHGIAYKDEPEAARAFLRELGNPFAKVGVDRSGRTGIDFGLTGVPETYIIDTQGHVRYRGGPLNREMLERDILPLLKELTA